MRPRASRIDIPGADYQFEVVGAHRTPIRDFYHALLRFPWWVTFSLMSATFLVANALFAIAYLMTGGIAHSSGSFGDAFFFSVQTMGTIGYGAMYPDSTAANALVVAESVVSLMLTALVTGLVFAKFSRPTARLTFTRHAVIAPMNGVPTLMFRLGNQRKNTIVDAQVRVVLMRTETTHEGTTFYRMLDLKLARERIPSLARSWNVLHPINEDSPLWGQSPAMCAAQDVEIGVQVMGLDDATMQTVFGAHRYFAKQVLWGARHVDILSEPETGVVRLDLRKFHDTEPTKPTDQFPYPERPPE